jgi:hypothetical protein
VKLLFLCNLFFFYSLNSWSITQVEFNNDQRILSGTPKRKEREFKISYLSTKNISLDQISSTLRNTIQNLLDKNQLLFQEISSSKYQLDLKTKKFIFKDIYFDTNQLSILKNRSSYRMRYRWNKEFKYKLYQYFPFMKFFYPSRFEIQFKGPYKLFPTKNYSETYETRFEFRNESNPFNDKNKAPTAPWKEEEYIKYAQGGFYKEYKLLPVASLFDELDYGKNENLQLSKRLELITVRRRLHLNIKSFWGSGPNPNQAFIITLDHITSKDSIDKNFNLIEIEVELERNISTKLDEYISNDRPVKNATLINAMNFAKSSRRALLTDLKSLKEEISNEIQRQYKFKKLKIDYKYSRLMNQKINSK